MDGERWLVRVLVTRDPESEGLPVEWDWNQLLLGGDPIVIRTELVGVDAIPTEVFDP